MSVNNDLPVTPRNPPGTGTPPASQPTQANQPPLTSPVKPAVKVRQRRSAILNLRKPLHPAISGILQAQATTLVSNIKLVRAADEKTNKTPLTNPNQDSSRKIALGMLDSFTQVKRRRLTEATLKGAAPSKTNKKSTMTETGDRGVRVEMKEFVTDNGKREFGTPWGQQGGAASTRPGEVTAIEPGFKSGDNTLQMLGHLAGLFMRTKSDLEYQALLVNDRIFVACNKEVNIASFKGMTLKGLIDDAAKNPVPLDRSSREVRPYLIAAVAAALSLDENSKTSSLTRVQEDGVAMLTEHEASHHADYASRGSIQSLLNLVQRQTLEPRQLVGPVDIQSAAVYLEADAYRDAVILVEPSHKQGWHAEQTLAMVLVQALWFGPSFVAGTKLPCLACWHTLNLLPLRNYGLTLVQQPGLYWSTETLKGLTLVAKALKFQSVAELKQAFILSQQHTYDAFHQFVTALEEQDDLQVTVPKKGDGGGLAALGLTQAQSQRSFYYPQINPNPVQITGAPYPDNVPGSPRGTYGTPLHDPIADKEDAEMAEYDSGLAEYLKQVEEYEKAVEAQKEAEKKAAEGEKEEV